MKRGAAVASNVRWSAGADGVAHAHRSSWRTRTACRLPAIDIRYARPATSRCQDCDAVLEAEG